MTKKEFEDFLENNPLGDHIENHRLNAIFGAFVGFVTKDGKEVFFRSYKREREAWEKAKMLPATENQKKLIKTYYGSVDENLTMLEAEEPIHKIFEHFYPHSEEKE